MNKKKSILIIIGIILFIVGIICGYKFYKYTHTDSYKFKKEYEKLNGKKNKYDKVNRTVYIKDDNPIKYSTAKEISKKINNKENFVVYFGFSECPWCRSMIENLITAAKNKGIDTIYYVDISDIRDVKEYRNKEIVTTKKGDKYYLKLIKQLDNVLSEYEIEDKNKNTIKTGEKRIYAPNIISIVNGNAEKLTDGISKKETNPYMKLTKSINNESIKKIECVLKCYLDSSSICTKPTSC